MTLSVARISPAVPDAAVPIPSELNCTLEVVLIDCGSDRVTPPVPAEATTWLVVPVIDVTPELAIVIDPDPVIEIPDPAVAAVIPLFVIVTAPVPPDRLIPDPATALVTPVFVIVTPPVAPDTEIPVPAILLVTPEFVIVIEPVPADRLMPVPAAAFVTPLFVIVSVADPLKVVPELSARPEPTKRKRKTTSRINKKRIMIFIILRRPA